MKFHDLAVGQHFELEGATYVKTSPVLASREDGRGNKFLARYVVVQPLDGSKQRPIEKAEKMLPSESVLAAFGAYYARCQEALKKLEGEIPADKLQEVGDMMDEERRSFLEVILKR